MSVRVEAILEAVTALPVDEREVFTKLFQDRQTTREKSLERDTTVQWPDFAGRMKAIFGKRAIPGDPQEFWDDERG